MVHHRRKRVHCCIQITFSCQLSVRGARWQGQYAKKLHLTILHKDNNSGRGKAFTEQISANECISFKVAGLNVQKISTAVTKTANPSNQNLLTQQLLFVVNAQYVTNKWIAIFLKCTRLVFPSLQS